jgi:putative endonuclease
MDRHAAGRKAEDIAATFLSAQGLELLLRNFRYRYCELDVVAKEREVLVIAEVRTRADDSYGGAAASITHIKRGRVVRATMELLQQHKEWTHLPVRFDVVVVSDIEADAPKVEWIKHAFDASR